MFCPNCSERKRNDVEQFCKRCGLDLFGLKEFVESGESGASKSRPGLNPGIKQGIIFLAIALVLVPIWMYIGMIFPPDDKLVESSPSTTPAESVFWILTWVFAIAGAARIGYTLISDGIHSARSWVETAASEKRTSNVSELPTGDGFHSARPGSWKTTGDLFESVKRRSRASGEL
jgi:hypothetical protein